MAKTVPGVPVDQFVEEYVTKPYHDDDGVQVSAGIGPDGKEYGDPVPMSPPVGYNPPPDLMTMIKTMLHNEEFMRRLNEEGVDTFEEAGDYDVEDDPPDPATPYERFFDPPPVQKVPQGDAPGTPPSPAPGPTTPAQTEGGGGGSPEPAPAPPGAKSSAST